MRVKDYITVEVNGVTIMVNVTAIHVDDGASAASAVNKLCRHIGAIESEQSYADESE